MLMKKIEKTDGLNISFRLMSIKNMPLHVHDAYEIIFVIKGTVNLKCTIFNYALSAGDVFIINVKELHSFSGGSHDNLILRMHLDPYEYLNIFPKLDFYLFICDSFSFEEKNDPKLIYLQQAILKIFFMVTDISFSVPQAEEQLHILITYLINHFQSFYLKKKGYFNSGAYQKDNLQLERVSEIQEYIYKNAKAKISLDDLAEHLHLNKYYISHLIKNSIGISMTDFLSLTRVEQSELLLLTTSMSIEQIALECGFSATRYYEKHFMRWFDMRPTEYRAHFFEEPSEDYFEYDLSCIHEPNIHSLLQQYLAVETSDKTFQNMTFSIDLSRQTKPFSHPWEGALIISDMEECMRTFPRELIEEAQKNIKFDKIKIFGLFSQQQSHYGNQEAAMPSGIVSYFDFLAKLELQLEFYFALSPGNFDAVVAEIGRFFSFFKHRYGQEVLKRWSIKIQDAGKLSSGKKFSALLKRAEEKWAPFLSNMNIEPYSPQKMEKQYFHNSMLMVPSVFQYALKENREKQELFRGLYDSAKRDKTPAMEGAYNGIFAARNERKPLYYAWQFLSHLGEELVYMADGIVITKQGGDYILLIYDHFSGNAAMTPKAKKRPVNVMIKIDHIQKRYTVTKLYLDSNNCLFQHRSALNFPQVISEKELHFINQATAPTVSFGHIDKGSDSHILWLQMNPYSAMLVILKETMDIFNENVVY